MTVGTGRLTLPAEENWTSEQRRAADLIAAAPRASLLGPFVPLRHSPELMTRLQLVGEYLRFQKVLDDDLLEVVILTVARHWDQQFEWGFHQPLAIRVGVPRSVTEEIQTGKRPSTGRDELALVWAATQALLVQGRLDGDVYQELSGMGPRAVVELMATVGYYTALALVMNVALTPAPEGAPALTVNMVRPETTTDRTVVMCSTPETHPTIDERHFRRIAGHLASGVTVVTTTDDEDRFGMTASSVTSLSADPALMLVCLNNAGPTAAAVARSGRYCVNVLGEQNGGLARRYAFPSEDKFQGIAVKTGLLEVPMLDEAMAHIECEVVDRFIRGTHSIFVGRVVAATARDGRPLTYFRGGFGRFALAEEDAAYRDARDLVLRRSYAAGGTIDVDVLAEALGVETASAVYALTRLEADGLVRREVDRGYVVTAFDTRTSDATFDARLIIELGVIEQVVGSLDKFQISRLRQRFEEMTQFLREDLFVDFDAYLDANYRFHETIVELAGNPLLTARFAELAIKQVMARSFGATLESSQQFLEVQRRIVEAFEDGDKESARDAARSYSAMAKERARALFALHGSEL